MSWKKINSKRVSRSWHRFYWSSGNALHAWAFYCWAVAWNLNWNTAAHHSALKKGLAFEYESSLSIISVSTESSYTTELRMVHISRSTVCEASMMHILMFKYTPAKISQQNWKMIMMFISLPDEYFNNHIKNNVYSHKLGDQNKQKQKPCWQTDFSSRMGSAATFFQLKA